MKNTDVVLVTTTFYKNTEELRFKLALETFRSAVKKGYAMVVVDNSPSEEVVDALKDTGVSVYPQTVRGMGPSRRQAFFQAIEVAREIGAKAILWLEPEKHGIVEFAPEIIKPIIEEAASVSVPYRTEISRASYPGFQIEMEEKQNKMSARYTGLGLDVSFGPVSYSIEAAVDLVLGTDLKSLGVPDTYVPQWLPTLAVRKGLKVASVPIDFIYPLEQKLQEEDSIDLMIRKRQEQLTMGLKAHELLGSL